GGGKSAGVRLRPTRPDGISRGRRRSDAGANSVTKDRGFGKPGGYGQKNQQSIEHRILERIYQLSGCPALIGPAATIGARYPGRPAGALSGKDRPVPGFGWRF